MKRKTENKAASQDANINKKRKSESVSPQKENNSSAFNHKKIKRKSQRNSNTAEGPNKQVAKMKNKTRDEHVNLKAKRFKSKHHKSDVISPQKSVQNAPIRTGRKHNKPKSLTPEVDQDEIAGISDANVSEEQEIEGKSDTHEVDNAKMASGKDKATEKSPAKKRKLGKDGDGSSKTKLEQLSFKDRKTERKKKFSNNFDLSMKAKKIWESVRSEKCPEDKRELMLNDLSNLITGKSKDLIFAHDTVRVMECLVALGTTAHRDKLFEELKDQVIPLSKSKYAKFFVLKMLKYGSKDQKDFIMKQLEGQIVRLIKHTEAASIVECAYNECANATQRLAMMEEFYGPDFALFKDSNGRSLSDILAKEPNRKDSIVKHMKELLLSLIEKSVVKHSMVHHALREFVTHADPTARSELIEASREVVVQVLHTKDGSRFAMHCLWHGTPKDRKAVIKSMKTHLTKICSEEEGHLVILALFDCVDDTKIVEKIIIQEIGQNLPELYNNVHGRKVLQYLLSPRDPHSFHPDIVSLLAMGDKNKYSKKDTDIRRREILNASSKMLLNLVEDRCQDLLKSNPLCVLMLTILRHATGSKVKANEAIVKCLAEPYRPMSADYCHPVESPSGNFLLKKLILFDKERHKCDDTDLFLRSLIDDLPRSSLSTWIDCNRGAFLVLIMLETDIDFVVKYVKECLLSFKTTLKSKKFKGAGLLLKKL